MTEGQLRLFRAVCRISMIYQIFRDDPQKDSNYLNLKIKIISLKLFPLMQVSMSGNSGKEARCNKRTLRVNPIEIRL